MVNGRYAGTLETDLASGFISNTLRSDNSVGRQMLCDPEWANKAFAGKKYRQCLRCNDCLMRTAAGLPVRCRINRDLGREKYLSELWRPPRKPGSKVVPEVPDLP